MDLTEQLAHSHDLRLPEWGPYSKKYIGISHLPDLQSGLRFDLSVLAGYYRRHVLVPNAKWESGFHPWEAASDLSYYSYRFQLEWKDLVFCDTAFSEINRTARLIRTQFHNNTSTPQNLVLHYMASMNFPPVRTNSDEPLRCYQVSLPKGGFWLDSLDYDDLRFAVSRPQDNLVYDGMRRAEIREDGFVGGTGVGMGFGSDLGDWVSYSFRLVQPIEAAVLCVRYRAVGGSARFEISGDLRGKLELKETRTIAQVFQPFGDLVAGEYRFQLESQEQAAVEFDGFAVIPASQVDQISFTEKIWQPIPQIQPGPVESSLVFKYENVDTFYGLRWLGEPWEVRQLYTDELDRFLRHYVQEHVRKDLFGNGKGHFTDVFMRPIEVPPGETRCIYGLVCSGKRSEVEEMVSTFTTLPATLEKMHQRAAARSVQFNPSGPGKEYQFSQERMAATVLTNVVYPIYTRRSYIRHYTPGKWWDSLYTWDSGFIGLGLLELDIERAVDCLNAYTTPPGDPQAAFLHHGSMVPTQHYLFLELWNRTQDLDLLAYFYPRLRQYYRFFAGHLGSSTTRRMRSNLLKTWDYFYNSGGWDDYPPQVYVHQQHLEATTTPVISTTHAIRTAKILQMAAKALGEIDDWTAYQADIDSWKYALNQYAWDEEAGYFSYVVHSPDGEPVEFLRCESGENYNMGLDGASPYFAGICSQEQEAVILRKLTASEHMWTSIGMCTVDKAAPYYKVDGYWNGAVWFPQQWFFWKAMLDTNQPLFAAQIAQTALDTWKKEVGESYHCFEHFIVQSGRGAGWHQFGGLSTPVLSWYRAAYQPGRLTTGFDIWIHSLRTEKGNQSITAELEYHGQEKRGFTVLAAMPDGKEYMTTWNGRDVPCFERQPGLLEISLTGQDPKGCLLVKPLERNLS